MTKKNKIMWAVDPFTVEVVTVKSAARALQALVHKAIADIEPVYIYSSRPDLKIRDMAKKSFSRALHNRKIPGLKSLCVVQSSGETTREMVDAFVAHAKSSQAQMMVVSKRAKKTSRWMLGSFSEMLLFRAGLPTLVVAPSWKRPADLRQMVFATDLSPPSQSAFEQALLFAKIQGAELTIYHKMERNRAFERDLTLGVYFSFENFIMETRRDREMDLEKLAISARHAGVPTKIVIETNPNLDAAESILKFSERHETMIGIVAHSGVFADSTMGSTAMRIIRTSERPVWVFSPAMPLIKRRKFSRSLGKKSGKEPGWQSNVDTPSYQLEERLG